MNLKNKIAKLGLGLYLTSCYAAGALAGKSAYDYLEKPNQQNIEHKIKSQKISWKNIGLGTITGLFTTGLLLSPYVKRQKRLSLPECPECENGRLETIKSDILDTFWLPGGNVGKLYYGMRATTEFEIGTDTVKCDRCIYQTNREYEKELGTYI